MTRAPYPTATGLPGQEVEGAERRGIVWTCPLSAAIEDVGAHREAAPKALRGKCPRSHISRLACWLWALYLPKVCESARVCLWVPGLLSGSLGGLSGDASKKWVTERVAASRGAERHCSAFGLFVFPHQVLWAPHFSE